MQSNKEKFSSHASKHQRLVAGVICLGVVALFVSLQVVEHYKIRLWPLGCGFKQRYALPCPTCGMTTATIAFANGRVLESFYIQPAAALLCSTLVISAFLAFFIAVFGVYFNFIRRFFVEIKIKYIILWLIIIATAAWAVTLARAMAEKYGK